MDRPTAIAQAGITLIASRGMRALTHHAVDDALDLPRGSTSYYARTRRDLVALIVSELVAQRSADLGAMTPPEHPTPESVAAILADAIDHIAQRPQEYLARVALLIEFSDDQQMRSALTSASPLRATVVRAAEAAMAEWGIDEPSARAADLVAVIDGLLAQVIIRRATPDVPHILAAYLRGLEHREQAATARAD